MADGPETKSVTSDTADSDNKDVSPEKQKVKSESYDAESKKENDKLEDPEKNGSTKEKYTDKLAEDFKPITSGHLMDDATIARESRNRVKLYTKNKECIWQDRGLGHVSCVQVTGQETFVILVKLDGLEYNILETKVQKATGFRKQNMHIVWSESGIDVGLSFREKIGCEQTWTEISSIISPRPDPVTLEDHTESTSNIEAKVTELPGLDVNTLPQFEAILSFRIINSTLLTRDLLAEEIIQKNVINSLRLLFVACEAAKDVTKLQSIASVAKSIVYCGDKRLLEYIFSTDIKMDFLGFFENDRIKPGKHREMLYQKNFREIEEFDSKCIRAQIMNANHIHYIMCLVSPAPVLENKDLLSTLTAFYFLYRCNVIKSILNDQRLVSEIFNNLRCSNSCTSLNGDLIWFAQTSLCNGYLLDTDFVRPTASNNTNARKNLLSEFKKIEKKVCLEDYDVPDKDQFQQEFLRVKGDSLQFCNPGFSTQYFENFINRENKVFPAETETLESTKKANVVIKQRQEDLLQSFKDLEKKAQEKQSEAEKARETLRKMHEALIALGVQKIKLPEILTETSRKNSRGRKLSESSSKSPRSKIGVVLHHCDECKKSTDQHHLIHCDTCKNWFHLACLDPPLQKMPKKVNYFFQCNRCVGSSDSEEHEVASEGDEDVEGGRNKRLRQRNEHAKAVKLAEQEEQNRAFKAAISAAGAPPPRKRGRPPSRPVSEGGSAVPAAKKAKKDVRSPLSKKATNARASLGTVRDLRNGRVSGMSNCADGNGTDEDFVLLDDDEEEL